MTVDWDAVDPEWRLEYLPSNADGDKGIWYGAGKYTVESEVLAALERYRASDIRVRVRERWVTQWQEAEYIGETYVGDDDD